MDFPPRDACVDYQWLLDRGYAERPALELVGNRHQLDRDRRQILFRGLSPAADAARRRVRVLADCAGLPLAVDGYNVLFLLYNHLLGRPVFLSADGVLRDAGGSHGSIGRPELFGRCLELLAAALAASAARDITVVLDRPVAHSADHLARLARLAGDGATSFILDDSADHFLANLAASHVLSTGDSALLDRAGRGVYDLGRAILEHEFQAVFTAVGGEPL